MVFVGSFFPDDGLDSPQRVFGWSRRLGSVGVEGAR